MSFRALITVVSLLAAGCANSPVAFVQVCHSDNECLDGQICFPEGCGDPGAGIVVEVSGDNSTGLYAQDFPIEDGGLSSRRDFDLPGPLMLIGGFQQEVSAVADPTNRVPYNNPVLVRAAGESELIPGVIRTYEARFSQQERNSFTMNIGAGRYTITALPDEPSLPPVTQADVVVGRDAQTTVNIAFPSVDGVITMEGRLIRRHVDGPPPMDLALTQPGMAMDLQAFRPDTMQPLSQRLPVSSGTPGSRGDFRLTLSPEARDLPSVFLVASPREAGSLLPTKTFTVLNPLPRSISFELGDYGDPVSKVTGTVLDSSGAPIQFAGVVIEGTVGGGGQFRSKVVTTDVQGLFAVDLLPNAAGSTFRLTVTPPSGNVAGVTSFPVSVEKMSDGAVLKPNTFGCDNRFLVEGSVNRPNSTPASGVTVRAVELISNERPLPLDDVETTTDSEGNYALRLDEGTWRIDFLPGEDLPRSSQTITVAAAMPRERHSPITLAKARRVSGLVTNSTAKPVAGKSLPPVPNATVRFFRVTKIGGKSSAVLLGSSIADEQGQYSVSLPTR